MVATKNHAIVIAVLSVLQLVAGVILLVICYLLFAALLQLASATDATDERVTPPALSIWWIFGLPYMIPGIMGIVAALTKHNAVIGVYMACNIIAMVICAIFVVGSIMYLMIFIVHGSVNCTTNPIHDGCQCRTGGGVYFSVDSPDCNALNNTYQFLFGVTTLICIGWCLCLVASIVCCAACCCSRPPMQGGIVMQDYPAVVQPLNQQQPYGQTEKNY